MTTLPLSQLEWQRLLSLLPPQRHDMARQKGAFTRKRQIQSPDDLLRMALVYAWAGYSLRNTAAWAQQTQLATLSDVALLERLQKAQEWLGWLVGQTLCTHCALPTAELPYTVRLVDATALCQPGSKGTDWRVHLVMNLTEQTVQTLTLTDASQGETLTQFAVTQNDLLVADRCYGHRAEIAHVLKAGGQVLVRFAAQRLPLQHPDGTPFDLKEALSGSYVPGQIQEWAVQTVPDPQRALPALSGRVLALRKDEAAAQAARRRARQHAKKHGHCVQEVTLLCCDFVLLFTTVPPEVASAATLLSLYRFRWQIECGFRRWKGIVHLDELPAYDPLLCRAWLYAKLLGALLIERIASSWAIFSPWQSPGGSLGMASVAGDLASVATGRWDRSVAGALVGRSDAVPALLPRSAA